MNRYQDTERESIASGKINDESKSGRRSKRKIMIKGTFIQTKQGLSASYKMLQGDQVCATAEIPQDVLDTELFYTDQNGRSYVLRHTTYDALKKRRMDVYNNGCSPYEICLPGNHACGLIYGKKTPGFFKGYQYTQMEFMNRQYAIYAIDIWKEGTKYAIYRNEDQERQIALVEKPEVVYNRLDEYSWMALFEEDIAVIGLYLLYIDYMSNAPRRLETVTESKEVSGGKTLNKALLAKYDENFKKM